MRIRSLKPEIWQSEDFIELDLVGELTFIALISLADDEGRVKTNAQHLHRVAIRHAAPDAIQEQLDVMSAQGMICQYEAAGSRIIQLLNWAGHQRVDRPSASRIPPPSANDRERSTNPRDHSRVLASVPVSRKDSSRALDPHARADRPTDQIDQTIGLTPLSADSSDGLPVEAVFEAWKEAAHKNGATLLTDKRRKLIRAALKLYPIEDVIDAVRGWRFSPHHTGENETRTVYNDIELLLRDARHLENFRDLQRRGGPGGSAVGAPGFPGGPAAPMGAGVRYALGQIAQAAAEVRS